LRHPRTADTRPFRAIGLFQGEPESRALHRAVPRKALSVERPRPVEIAEYLKGIAHDSFATYGVNPDDIVLAVDTEDIPLGVDAAISCGLIVNELVSNSLKHAFPDRRQGLVEVTLRSAGNEWFWRSPTTALESRPASMSTARAR